jgi:hypothetical protein
VRRSSFLSFPAAGRCAEIAGFLDAQMQELQQNSSLPTNLNMHQIKGSIAARSVEKCYLHRRRFMRLNDRLTLGLRESFATIFSIENICNLVASAAVEKIVQSG